MGNDTTLLGLFRKRQVFVPTWRAWVLGVLAGILAAIVVIRWVHPFLALDAPVNARVVVVEGWAPDHALRIVAEELKAGRFDRVYVTGIPMDRGAPLSEYRTYAELGAAVLIAFGAGSNQVQAVPAPTVPRDRTYTSAVALRLWFEESGQMPPKLDVATVSAHSRRSRLLFQKAFGDQAEIGVIALPEQQYEAASWWKYSHGVRVVVGELISYLYARFIFEGDRDTPEVVRAVQRGEQEPAP